MRAIAPIAAIAVLALAACSPDDSHRASGDRTDAGRSVDDRGQGVAQNPDVKNVEADFRKVGHDAAQETRKLAAQAKVETHKLASGTRGATHDVTRHDRSDNHSS